MSATAHRSAAGATAADWRIHHDADHDIIDSRIENVERAQHVYGIAIIIEIALGFLAILKFH